MSYLGGYLGSAEIARQPFVSASVPEWRGNQKYAGIYYAALRKRDGGQGATDMALPTLLSDDASFKDMRDSKIDSTLYSLVEEGCTAADDLLQKKLKDKAFVKSTCITIFRALVKGPIDPLTIDGNKEKLTDVISITGLPEDKAKALLSSCAWDKARAVQKHFENESPTVPAPQQPAPASAAAGVMQQLQIRLPNGSVHPIQISSTANTWELRQHVHRFVQQLGRPFTIRRANNQPIPDDGRQVRALGLVYMEMLHVQLE